jgi:hypothetical protein
MSYNPSYTDHQNLLQEVADKELKVIKEEKHLKRVTSKMFSRVTEDEHEVCIFVIQQKRSVLFIKVCRKQLQSNISWFIFPSSYTAEFGNINEINKGEVPILLVIMGAESIFYTSNQNVM